MAREAYSKLTVKCQTVFPKAVRERLGLKPGDRVRYRETTTGIVIERANDTADDPFASFTEWTSEEDDRAYANL